MIFLPINIGLIMVGTVYIKEKINDLIQRHFKSQ